LRLRVMGATISHMDGGRHRRWIDAAPALMIAAGGVLLMLVAAGSACQNRTNAVNAPPPTVGALATVAELRLLERTTVSPVFASIDNGRSSYRMPRVNSTQRVEYEADTGRIRGIELALAEPLLVYSRPGKQADQPPRVALTFDDGPSSIYTPQMLEIMREYGAHVTFFVLGGIASGQRGLVRQASEEGHEIGIHSWSHPQFTKLSDTAIASDLARCRALLDPLVQRPIRWFRPPYGDHNKRVDAAINAAGLRVAMWSIDPRDWTAPGSSVVAGRVLSRVRDGSVVCMHDGGRNRGGTVAAMRIVVPELQKRGFQLVTMSQLAGIDPTPPDDRGMLLTIGDRQFRIEGGLDDIKVRVDGVEIELATPPMKTKGQFLVHGRPVLAALGASCVWHDENLTLEVQAARGLFMVKLNSQQMTVNGKEVFVQVPAVFYDGQGLLSVWLIANACGARVSYNDAERAIDFLSASAMDTGLAPHGRRDTMVRRGLDGMTICGVPYTAWSL